MGPYRLGHGELVFPVGRLWTADSRDGSHAARSGRRAHPADTALSHGRVEGLYRGAAPGRGGGVSSPPTWERGAETQAAGGGSESLAYYAQVVKCRNKAGQVVDVRRRVVFGGPRRFVKQLCLRQLGETIQTAFMERWYGTLRGLVAPLRRRTRWLSWSRLRHRGKVWLMVSLYNFVLPHKSLRQG